MPKPDDVGVGTAMIVLSGEGRVLLLKRKGAHRAGCWAVPGGWLDRADADTEIACCRETYEETGITVHTAEKHTWVTEDHPEIETRTVTLYFIARPGDWEGTAEILEPDKCSEMGWFWPCDAHKLELFPGLFDVLHALGPTGPPTGGVAQRLALRRALDATDEPRHET